MTRDEDREPDESDTPNPTRGRHFEVLLVAVAVPLLASLLVILPGGRVAFRGLTRYPLPETCAARAWFGATCPGCGLTRGMIHAVRGDWSGATAENRVALLIAFAIVVQIPYRLICLRLGRPPFGNRIPWLFGSLLIASLLMNWLVGVWFQAGGPGLP